VRTRSVPSPPLFRLFPPTQLEPPVIALDNDETRLKLARHNAAIYGVADRIEFILTDYISWAHTYLSLPHPKRRSIDVVFLSPPWGGPGYLHEATPSDPTASVTTPSSDDDDPPRTRTRTPATYHLSSIQPLPGDALWRLTRQITPNVAFYLPRNVCHAEVEALLDDPALVPPPPEEAPDEPERIELEQAFMGPKLKACTAYAGGLAAGQEDLFWRGIAAQTP
jgi:trimethylguanosine synthase